MQQLERDKRYRYGMCEHGCLAVRGGWWVAGGQVSEHMGRSNEAII